MTKQEIFKKVKRHLLRQKKRASDSKGNCKYLTNNGLKCAVGCLIPKSAYDPEAEGVAFQAVHAGKRKWVTRPGYTQNAGSLADMLNKAKIPATMANSKLLSELQAIHDEYLPTQWAQALDDLEETL